jgi:hypothetical protein
MSDRIENVCVNCESEIWPTQLAIRVSPVEDVTSFGDTSRQAREGIGGYRHAHHPAPPPGYMDIGKAAPFKDL